MSSGYCQALGCDSTRQKNAGISFFRFPDDDQRCGIWVQRSRNPKLVGLTSKELNRTARLCSRHFPLDAFMSEERKRLRHNALPSDIIAVEDAGLEPMDQVPEPELQGSPDADLPATKESATDEQEVFIFGDPDNEVVLEYDPESPRTSVLGQENVTPTRKSVRGSLEILSMPGSSQATSSRTTGPQISPFKTPSPLRSRLKRRTTGPQISPFKTPSPLRSRLKRRTTGPQISPFKTPSPPRSRPKPQQKRRHSVLREIGATRMTQLTPRKRKLVGVIQKTKKLVQALQRRYKSLQEGTRSLKSSLQGDFIRQIEQNISPAAARLFARQLACGKKPPKGRRFTIDDKVLALSLYKRGPKAYKLFQTMFAVPTPRTLISLLNRLPFSPGINETIFNHLREKVAKMPASDRVCALLFDEVSLSTGLHYSEKLDHIVGFEDYGDLGRKNVVANHALVFMVRGLTKKWKQPVAYYFCKDVTKTNILQTLIVHVIESLQKVGLNIVCTICDQGSTNRAALQNLVQSHPSNLKIGNHGMIFKVNNDDIAVIYDPPHLLKSLRNAFMKYNVVWTPENPSQEESEPSASTPPQRAEASWQHIKMFAAKDKETIFQRAKKLTKAHLEPNAQEKMRVNLAAEVFSETVAVGINSMVPDPTLFNLAEPPSSGSHFMPEAAKWTAKLILDVDKLFDSFNGTRERAVNFKYHRVALSSTSIHETFWPEMLKLIDSWEFTDKETGRVQRSPFQDGWLTTIQGAIYVGKILGEKFDVHILQLNSLNQDAIENLFCIVRQHGIDNSNPTCVQFASALKTCIINNLTKFNAKGSNCKADSDVLLSDLKSFLFSDAAEPAREEDDAPEEVDTASEAFSAEDISDEIENENSEFNLDDDFTEEFAAILEEMRQDATLVLPANERQTIAFICGYIVRKVADLSCEQCKSLLTLSSGNYSDQLITSIGLAAMIIEKQLRKAPHIFNLKNNLMSQINSKVDFSWLQCNDHGKNLLTSMLTLLCRFTIHHFCHKQNHLMKYGPHDLSSRSKHTSQQKRLRKVLHK